ncbi:hypothetical protein V6N13_107976 [Hibiscus sabdariffa]|uniref:TOD1/MUCI70 glycosyltransferase-like domain-containing protein n=1 Tax=Hibiscus sabdariffa TaxID=183260 RepID=A0ABR2SQV8_9ROSI
MWKLTYSLDALNICICFFLVIGILHIVAFWDEITLAVQESQGSKMGEDGLIGIWRIVIVRNLPFVDQRLYLEVKIRPLPCPCASLIGPIGLIRKRRSNQVRRW